MCGITGIVAFTNKGRQWLDSAGKATALLNKRGPDNQGLFSSEIAALGHARLSIIDTSALGNQPMYDATDRYVIVYNGEVYNFQNYRESLIKEGVIFKSMTDTEVLLNMYIKEGPAFLDKLNGFFAIAIWDEEKEELFVARDRIGIKPLHIYLDENALIFASELKAILSYPVKKELDYNSLQFYLQLNYLPREKSILKNTRKLLPGSYLLVNQSGIVKEEQYYNLEDIKRDSLNHLSYDDAKKDFASKLDDAVRLRMIADVPLGAFLSGGIDSSVIVSLASRHTKDLKTFSIGYKDEPFFDETSYAQLVAAKFKTDHHVFSLTNSDLFKHLYNVLESIDEPFADSSALAVYILSERTRKHVKVALSGDGADELFLGYNKHMAEFRARSNSPLNTVVKALHPVWEKLPKSRNSKVGNLIRQFHRFSSGMKHDNANRYWSWCTFIDENEAESMMSDASKSRLRKDQYQQSKDQILKLIKEDGDINDQSLADLNLVLPGDMLVKVDLMSMANSLEVRVPFLDHNLVEFALKLPAEYKIDAGMKKKVVQDAFRSVLPPELYKRPKHGFEVPLLKWLKTDLRSLIYNELLEKNFIVEQGIFAPDQIEKLLRELESNNPGDATARIWGLLVFQYWWKKHMND